MLMWLTQEGSVLVLIFSHIFKTFENVIADGCLIFQHMGTLYLIQSLFLTI